MDACSHHSIRTIFSGNPRVLQSPAGENGVALHAKNHHGWSVDFRASGCCRNLSQAGGAKPLGADFIRLVRALRFDGARAVGDR